MPKQFSQSLVIEDQFAEAEKPSFLSRFIFVVVSLGILTVIGVVCYSASTRYARKASDVQPVKITAVQPISQSEPSVEDGLEPMVEAPATNVPGETALPPVQSPFEKPPILHPTPAAGMTPKMKVSQVKSDVTTDQTSTPETVLNADAVSVPDRAATNSTSPEPLSESPVPVPETPSNAPAANP